MSFSSTSSTLKRYKYDVFLSFRGEDVRKNFVDHLFFALQRQGIHTFKDDPRLEKGRRINYELLKSIEESKFYIIVFSKNYASSSWCLDELVKIMECQKATEQIAYPVFYDVDPSEVRKQTGSVGEALKIHNDRREIEKWREALKEVANLSGWDLRKTDDGHEAKLVSKIVQKIALELHFINMKVEDKLVGMESRIKDIVSSLAIGVEDVRMIGIKGIGGGGKTTLARAVFEKICFSFEGKSFVENIREVSKPSMSGLRSLQQQVLSDVLNDKSITVGSVHDGKSTMKNWMCGQKVLLVLDDVDHLDQLDALAGGLNWFKPGSRVIITTRDEQVLIAHRVKWIHDVNLLSDEEAICLFSRYAFGRGIPVQRYKELSLKVVHYAAGLPLTIRVLGASLCGKDTLEWKDALKRLKTIPLRETLEKLELSYIALENDHKEIFLDVACLLKGWKKDDAIRALESCGFHGRNGLRVLERKSLITISHDQELRMHDHIEEMGQNIVRRFHPDEPSRHSRLWIRREIEDLKANELVTEATGVKFLEFLSTRAFPLPGTGNICSLFPVKGFGNMTKLRFLHVESYPHYVSEVGHNIPNALRFLSWTGYPHCCLPKTFQPNQLVALELPNSMIKQLWEEGEIKVLKNLKFLDLSDSKLTTLDCGFLLKLEKLKLKGCYHLVDLHVPTRCLRKLVYLDLNGCKGIESLLFIQQLKSLEVLDLSDLDLTELPADIIQGCKYSLLEFKFSKNNIKELPSSIGELENLVTLDLSWCKILKSLPQSICGLQRLKNLKLESCAIKELPKDFGDLERLEWLNLKSTHLRYLPSSICMLKHLKTLLLARCRVSKELPEDLGLLESLEELSLACCKIRDVPSSISKLKHLRELNLRYCDQLKRLPDKLGDLKCLQRLNVHSTSISHLPDSISVLRGLKIVGFTLGDRSIHSSTLNTTVNIPGCLKKYARIERVTVLLETIHKLNAHHIRKAETDTDTDREDTEETEAEIAYVSEESQH